jgi:D-alanyl-D-alanine carboxypeptidase (penicillin-binding protein 5/6)
VVASPRPSGVARAAGDDKNALAEQLNSLIESHPGVVTVAVKHLDTGESFAHAANRPMSTASLIKFPLMIATYRAIEDGQLDLGTMIELRDEDKVPGSGILTESFSAGTKISLHDAIRLMMAYSDNTATNLVIDQVGLPATASFMEKLGCPHTKLHSKVFRRDTSIFPERSQEFGLGSTSAGDMIRLFEQVHAGTLVSKDACAKMLEHLHACRDRTKLPRLVPEETTFAHKTGWVTNTRADAGIMETPAGPIAVCVLVAQDDDHRWTDDDEPDLLCAEIGLAVYRHFNPDGQPVTATMARVLKVGSGGELVEALQRTLNKRLDPSPQLGVDGDFGPMTESAVLRFQKENALDENGTVGPEFWRTLGPLVTADDYVADIDAVNTTPVDKSPPDPLDGQPFATSKAWAIADGQTGQVLWGYNDAQPRDPASTTKIMTAYVVTRLAEDDPSVLDEMVTFSERADETSGSTSGVKAGEQVSVRNLLYGLLLPSGNDASVALAEHFGERLASDDAADDADPYVHFVAAMNRTAAELGMNESHFENTHGLTHADHKLSPRDLVRLSWSAMQQPLFRGYVSTSEFGCTLESLSGYQRNVIWRNTNRLLATEGYDGVKTGTTGAAGACLVSHAYRGNRELLMVVLGSSSSDARYADSRNLYRWAWQQLGVEE